MRSGRPRPRWPASLIVALLVQIVAGRLAAQDSFTLHTDARVRFMTVGADRWVVGRLLTPPRDSVRLLAGNAEDRVAVATASLARFEISRGRRRQTIRGAWIGAAAGAVAGFVYGLAAYEPCRGFCPAPEFGQGGEAALGGVLGGLFGLGIGALIGSQFTAERWSPVPQPWGTGRVSAAVDIGVDRQPASWRSRCSGRIGWSSGGWGKTERRYVTMSP